MRKDSRRTTLCGTVEYLPPEVESGAVYGFGFDMWTVGVLLYEMLAGYSPFAGPEGMAAPQESVLANIRAGAYAFPPSFPADAADCVKSLLLPEADRVGPTDVLQHAWIERHCGKYKPQADTRLVKVECIAPWGVESASSAAAAAELRGGSRKDAAFLPVRALRGLR